MGTPSSNPLNINILSSLPNYLEYSLAVGGVEEWYGWQCGDIISVLQVGNWGTEKLKDFIRLVYSIMENLIPKFPILVSLHQNIANTLPSIAF